MKPATAALLAAAALCLAVAGCKSEKSWTLQSTVDNLLGDIDSLFGASSLPGKHLAAIRSVHEAKSWTFLADADDPLDTTRNAVRGLSTCDYASWQEAALVVEIVSSMADEHLSSLVRAEALDTLRNMAPWTVKAVVPRDHPSTMSELIEAIKVLKQSLDKTDADPAFTFKVATAVATLANYPFEHVESMPEEGPDNKAAARAVGGQLKTARGALRSINGKALEGMQADPGVHEALDRAYVALSASVIRLTLEKAGLGDSADTTRAAAVRNLGILHPQGGTDVLRRVLLYDGFASVRREAAKSLSSYPPAEAVPSLIEALVDEMAEVRGAAVRSLEALTGQKFGDDRTAWIRWWQTRSTMSPAPSGQPVRGQPVRGEPVPGEQAPSGEVR